MLLDHLVGADEQRQGEFEAEGDTDPAVLPIGPSSSVGARTDSSFVIFALKCFLKYLVDSWVQGIVRVAVIADINRDRNAAMNVTFVAPLPKSDVSLLSDDVTFPA
jgi:hypothetical protein